MAFISILVGLALLLAGRKIFWLVVATIGFIAGIKLTAFNCFGLLSTSCPKDSFGEARGY